MNWKIKAMFETTNQCLLLNSCEIIIFLGEIHQKISPNVLARKGRPVGLLGLGVLSNGACLGGRRVFVSARVLEIPPGSKNLPECCFQFIGAKTIDYSIHGVEQIV